MRTAGLWGVLALCGLASADRLSALRAELLSGDEVRVPAAAKRLGATSDDQAIEILLDGISRSGAPRLLSGMLTALGGKRDGRAVAVLAHYTKNRNVELRIRAVAALGQQSDKRAVAALLAALSDSSAEVRAEAASALGKRKERSAEASLLKLLLHKDPSAAEALAAIATPELAHRLLELLGQVPDSLLCTTLGEILKRSDFGPDPIRIEVVKTLAKVPGSDSTVALVEYIAATQRDKARPSRLEAQKIVDQRSGQ